MLQIAEKLGLEIFTVLKESKSAKQPGRPVFSQMIKMIESKKADVEINAADLLNAFETDEAKANELYLGKIVSVTGIVESVSEDSVGISVYLKENEAFAGIICSFDRSADNVTSIDKGNTVEIKGICTGYLMDVVLNRCAVVSQQK
jgi:hypothetical protein